jgi:hypothetical protein
VSLQETEIEISDGPETGRGASNRTRGSLSDRWEIIQVRLDQPLHPVRTPENAAGLGEHKSGKCWKPGSRYYGKTKQGEYMSGKDAVQKGYLPENGTGEHNACE